MKTLAKVTLKHSHGFLILCKFFVAVLCFGLIQMDSNPARNNLIRLNQHSCSQQVEPNSVISISNAFFSLVTRDTARPIALFYIVSNPILGLNFFCYIAYNIYYNIPPFSRLPYMQNCLVILIMLLNFSFVHTDFIAFSFMRCFSYLIL